MAAEPGGGILERETETGDWHVRESAGNAKAVAPIKFPSKGVPDGRPGRAHRVVERWDRDDCIREQRAATAENAPNTARSHPTGGSSGDDGSPSGTGRPRLSAGMSGAAAETSPGPPRPVPRRVRPSGPRWLRSDAPAQTSPNAFRSARRASRPWASRTARSRASCSIWR